MVRGRYRTNNGSIRKVIDIHTNGTQVQYKQETGYAAGRVWTCTVKTFLKWAKVRL